MNINGSIRELFSECNYLGIDIGPGKDVDRVISGHQMDAADNSFDVSFSCECFEHNKYWMETFQNMHRMTKENGLIFFSCATHGRPEHGTHNRSSADSPYTLDYYKNLGIQDFIGEINLDEWFSNYCFEIEKGIVNDIYFWGIKKMKYITCNFQGRLGNLMYEIACTLATAWKNDATPVFPRKVHQYYKDLDAFQSYISPILEQFYQFDERRIKFKEYHEAADYAYQPIEVTENIKLFGYFTTSLYFDHYREKIIDIFSTNQQYVNDMAQNIRNKYPGREFVSVHVRRTDYVTDYKWDLPLSYYEQAEKHFDNPIFVIFSDDPDWCRENMDFMKEKVFVQDKDYLELLLMGKFDAHIIGNSTFSSWGAILGDREKIKKVIAPQIWSPAVHNQNIQEKHWILI